MQAAVHDEVRPVRLLGLALLARLAAHHLAAQHQIAEHDERRSPPRRARAGPRGSSGRSSRGRAPGARGSAPGSWPRRRAAPTTRTPAARRRAGARPGSKPRRGVHRATGPQGHEILVGQPTGAGATVGAGQIDVERRDARRWLVHRPFTVRSPSVHRPFIGTGSPLPRLPSPRRPRRCAAPGGGARRRPRVNWQNPMPSTPASTPCTCFRPDSWCFGRSTCEVSPVTTADEPKPDARQEHLHLLDGGVLRLVHDDERVVQRAAAHVGERRDLDDVPLDELAHALDAEELVQRIVDRTQVGVDLLHHVARQEAQALAGLDRPGAPARAVARGSVSSASTAQATARNVLPVPAGPMPKVRSRSLTLWT